MRHGIKLLTLVAVSLMVVAHAGADTILFDDANGTGWTRPWYTTTETTSVYAGTTALQSSNGQIILNNTGFSDDSDYILEFYVNTTQSTTAINLLLKLTYTESGTSAAIPFKYLVGCTAPVYVIDGVETSAITYGMAVDTDTTTWQLVQIDLSQLVYAGWPYVGYTYTPGEGVITQISLTSYNSSGAVVNAGLIVDNMSLTAVPEPATMALLACGGVAVLVKKRRNA